MKTRFRMPKGSLRETLAGGLLVVVTTASGADWPQWHGPGRDRHAGRGDEFPQALPGELQPLWKIPLGAGHSSPVVEGDRVLVLDEKDSREVARLLDAATGRTVWSVPFAPRFEDEWGAGPRSMPTLEATRAFVQSCDGRFFCLNRADGAVVWQTEFEKDFGVRFLGSQANEGTASRRGNTGAPLVDGGEVIVPVGSIEGATLVCFDKGTGAVRWKAGTDEAAYSSPVVATLAGRRQVIYFSAEALMGVDRERGTVLWRVPLRTAAKRHVATPLVEGDGVMVNSHTFGAVRFRVTAEGGGFRAEEVWSNRDLKINIATAVRVDGHLYSMGANRDLVCFEAATGAVKWSRPGFGQGRKDYASVLASGRRLLVLTEDGTLVLAAADPSAYRELGRLQVCGNTWSFPAYAGGRLYVRDGRFLYCYALTAGS